MRFLSNIVFALVLTAFVGSLVHGTLLAIDKAVEQSEKTIMLRFADRH